MEKCQGGIGIVGLRRAYHFFACRVIVSLLNCSFNRSIYIILSYDVSIGSTTSTLVDNQTPALLPTWLSQIWYLELLDLV